MLITLSVNNPLNMTDLDGEDIYNACQQLVEAYRDGTMDNEGVYLSGSTERHSAFEIIGAICDEYPFSLKPGENLKLYIKHLRGDIHNFECELYFKSVPSRSMI